MRAIVVGTVSSLLLSCSALGQTNVGGPILSDTTWGPSGSPYIVQNSIIVGAGATLTVEPGTEVRVNNGLSIAVGSQAFGPGALVVNGTEAAPALFTSNQGSGRGDWNDIYFTSHAVDTQWDENGEYISGSRLRHCIISYAGGTADSSSGAVSNEENSLELEGVRIRESARDGLYSTFGSGSTARIRLRGCEVSDCTKTGVSVVRGASHLVSDGTVQRCGSSGVSISSAPDCIVVRTTASECGGTGIILQSTQRVVVEDCQARDNGGDGLYINSAGESVVTSFGTSGNGSEGATFAGCSSLDVAGLESADNTQYGVRFDSCSGLAASAIDCHGNNGGANVNGGTGVVADSRFSDNYRTGNGGGVLMTGSAQLLRCEIQGNTASGVGGGIYIDSSNQRVQECVIESNAATSGGGAYVNRAGASFAGDEDEGTFNAFWANTATSGNGADIYNNVTFNSNGSGDIDASYVCWGTEDFNDISARIHDFFDDSNKGVVAIFPPAPCSRCPADITGDGVVNTQDFVAFLNAWAGGNSVADWNGDGTINTQDFVAYLNDWAAGC
ncbi:MAG: right-handed parallel beta-helix repeat-containing protein [Phycisphaerales bacterium]|nr:right-handed parallel beta-helix repeat-containing protein [Phycisphaerales bacterium]